MIGFSIMLGRGLAYLPKVSLSDNFYPLTTCTLLKTFLFYGLFDKDLVLTCL